MATTSRQPGATRTGGEQNGSVGRMISEITTDAQHLVRQEVELAKAEVRQEVGRAGKAAGMFGGAGFAGYMVAFFLSLALMFGLANVLDAGWAGLITAGLWAIVGAALFIAGRARMRRLSATPKQTVETLKEDARWARHPTA
ncbi:phage holin family protein [Streptomyces marincola]|uniref:phage holin family protein n=1 Tax=Streptomyces marincola TaxID=2878388 RepID=UPI001CF285D3|nr:phage holin family protein [Streptomyces marincola]UCM91384.1 phage holin family protein [Streptomyces marincola]